MATQMSSTQRRRAAYDYRKEFFKLNPGLFGNVWFCSQCFKPLIGKSSVQVDHIIPLGAGGRNHVSNCTACCAKCNHKKSDHFDYRVGIGVLYKQLERAMRHVKSPILQTALLIGMTALWVARGLTVGLAFKVVGKTMDVTVGKKKKNMMVRRVDKTMAAIYSLRYIFLIIVAVIVFMLVSNAI